MALISVTLQTFTAAEIQQNSYTQTVKSS